MPGNLQAMWEAATLNVDLRPSRRNDSNEGSSLIYHDAMEAGCAAMRCQGLCKALANPAGWQAPAYDAMLYHLSAGSCCSRFIDRQAITKVSDSVCLRLKCKLPQAAFTRRGCQPCPSCSTWQVGLRPLCTLILVLKGLASHETCSSVKPDARL